MRSIIHYHLNERIKICYNMIESRCVICHWFNAQRKHLFDISFYNMILSYNDVRYNNIGIKERPSHQQTRATEE